MMTGTEISIQVLKSDREGKKNKQKNSTLYYKCGKERKSER